MEEESLKFLSKIFDLLSNGVLNTNSNNQKSIVDFKHPEELKVSYQKKAVTEAIMKWISSTINNSLQFLDKSFIVIFLFTPFIRNW